MENLEIAIYTVLPLLLMLILGNVLMRKKVITSSIINPINSLIFKVFLPCTLFKSIYLGNFKDGLPLNLIFYSIIILLIFFIFLIFAVKKLTMDNKKRGALLHGMIRGNVGVFGIILAERLLPDESMGNVSVVMGIMLFVLTLMGIISLELFSVKKLNGLRMIKNICKNPLQIAIFLSLTLNLCDVSIPLPLIDTINTLAGATSPVSFIIIGASFNFSKSMNNGVLILCAMFVKMLLLPVTVIAVGGMCFGFRNEEIIILMTIFATPTAVGTVSMAVSSGADDNLAGDIVIYTTTVSLIVLTALIFSLKSIAWI